MTRQITKTRVLTQKGHYYQEFKCYCGSLFTVRKDVAQNVSSCAIKSECDGIQGDCFAAHPVYTKYLVSKDGVVRIKKNNRKNTPRNMYGYKRITISYRGEVVNKSVHSLVLETFVGTRPLGLQINHIDGDKQNNSIDNLEYVTASQNLKHAYSIGLKNQKRENHNRAKLTEKLVNNIKTHIHMGIRNKDIAEKYNVSASLISCIRRGTRWA